MLVLKVLEVKILRDPIFFIDNLLIWDLRSTLFSCVPV